MSPFEQAGLQFLQASIGCAVAGAAVWAALWLALRHAPALAAQRWAWLLPQLMIAATFLLMLAPQSGKFSLVPAIDMSVAQARPAPLPAALADDGSDALLSDGDGAGWLLRGAQLWLLVYVAGLGLAGHRWMRARRVLRGLRHAASEVVAPHLHAGLYSLPADMRALTVFEIDAPVSPMLIGVRKPCLLLPRHLRNFDAQQQQLVVAHELTHLRRRDPLWMAASTILQTMLWFHPVMRRLGHQLTWAQELSCDQQVLRGRAQGQRQAYAAALLAQLKLQQVSFGAAMAFGAHGSALAARILLIRQNGGPGVGTVARCAVIGALAAILAGSLLLRPALAWSTDSPPALSAPAPQRWQGPLAQMRVSSFFGSVLSIRKGGHRGIDFGTRTGTPVMASADGVVVSSADTFDGQAKYGKTILIDHGGKMTTLYAHLDQRRVAAGDTVRAGQVIGLSGATGKVTGPHLHFEMRKDSQPINPETLIAGLAANATPAALKARLSP